MRCLSAGLRAIGLLAGIALAMIACTPADKQITIGSNPAGTHVYTVAAGLAQVLGEQGQLRSSLRPFSGSSVYLPMLQRGEIALGLNTGIDSYLAYQGLPPYSAPMSNLRTIGAMFALPIAYMVNANADIRSVEDLRGKRVVVAFRANAALEQLHTGILATGGLAVSDVQNVTVAGLPEAMQLIRDGRADAAPTGLNTSLAMEVDAALSNGIRYITLGSDEARLAQIMPGAEPATISPRAGLSGVTEDIRVANTLDFLNTSIGLDDDTAYTIARTIHENWDALRRDHAPMASMSDDGLVPINFFLPFHAGAVRYYEEAGLWTPAHAANQARLLGE